MDTQLRQRIPPSQHRKGASCFERLGTKSAAQNTTCNVPMHIKFRKRNWALARLTFELVRLDFGLAEWLLR